MTDAIMDYFEALPLIQDDPHWLPLMVSILATVGVQRLAYREEGLEPTDDQTRVLIAMGKAMEGAWAS